MSTSPISYHTFIFPFLWTDGGKMSREKFTKCLNRGWKEDILKDIIAPTDTEFYAKYRYFNQAAINAMFTSADKTGKLSPAAVVWNYRFDIQSLSNSRGDWLSDTKSEDNPAKYVITKGNKTFELPINGIRLKLFNTGVGMIIFELENYKYKDEKEIIEINEYGRRVFMPFIYPNRTCSICADSISLTYGDDVISSGIISGASLNNERDIMLAEPIDFLLTDVNNGYSITTNEIHQANEFFIEPIIDDRMFVACYYNNGKFAEEMSEWTNGTYKYLYDAENMLPSNEKSTANRLYRMMFIDGDGITCHSRKMLKDMLEKYIYDRWVENYYDGRSSGTITGINEYCMISVSDFEYGSVSFLSEYIEMLILVLAQRASLLSFERTISEIACEKSSFNIGKVQKSYVLFQSELLLQEVTPQQQGIELYDRMREYLYITKQQSEIESQIKSLFELNAAAHDRAENIILFMLALLGVFEVVSTAMTWWENKELCVGFGWVFIFSAILMLIYARLRRKR